MTFKEIQDRVIRKLQENSTPEYWSLEEIKDAINDGYREIVRLTDFLKVRKAVNLFGSGYFSIPDDALEIKTVYYKGKPLTPVSEHQLDRGICPVDYTRDNCWTDARFDGYWGDVSGEPLFYTMVDSLIRIVPFPDDVGSTVLCGSSDGFGVLISDSFGLFLPTSSDEDLMLKSKSEFWGGVPFLVSLTESVFIEYIKLPNKLINDGDIPDIPLAYHDALEYYTLYELFSREGTTQDIRKATFYFQLFEARAREAKGFVKQRSPKLNLPFFI